MQTVEPLSEFTRCHYAVLNVAIDGRVVWFGLLVFNGTFIT